MNMFCSVTCLRVRSMKRDDQLGIHPMEEPDPDGDSGGQIRELAKDTEEAYGKREFIVNDAISNLVRFSQEQAIVGFSTNSRRHCKVSRSIVVVTHPHANSDGVISRINGICDNHFKLKIGKMGIKIVQVIDVARVNSLQSVLAATASGSCGCPSSGLTPD